MTTTKTEIIIERRREDSGGFNNALGRLRTMELITRGQPITASDELFAKDCYA
jgi:hypothetical protein